MKYAQETIADFLKGGLEIREFRRLYDERPEIDAFLQKIIDDMKKDRRRRDLLRVCLLNTQGSKTTLRRRFV